MTPLIPLIVASALAQAPEMKAPAHAEAPAEKPAAAAASSKKTEVASMHTAGKADEAKLKSLTSRYRTAKSVTMKVAKTLKLGLLGEERKSAGTMTLSNGQLRLELEGAEKTLLVVNKKNLWAVTFPPPEFKDAVVQVIKADTASTKAKSQALTGLLGAGDLSKSFKATAVQTTEKGEANYFLSPVKDTADFKRAQLLVAKDGKSIVELKYWDERDNETSFEFTDAKFGKKADPKLFDYTPPANADVMAL